MRQGRETTAMVPPFLILYKIQLCRESLFWLTVSRETIPCVSDGMEARTAKICGCGRFSGSFLSIWKVEDQAD